jgi:hypothetical protein
MHPAPRPRGPDQGGSGGGGSCSKAASRARRRACSSSKSLTFNFSACSSCSSANTSLPVPTRAAAHPRRRTRVSALVTPATQSASRVSTCHTLVSTCQVLRVSALVKCFACQHLSSASRVSTCQVLRVSALVTPATQSTKADRKQRALKATWGIIHHQLTALEDVMIRQGPCV